VIKAVGAPMLGMFNSSHWAHDLTTGKQALRRRVPEGIQALPSLYASQGYDAALLIDAAVRDVKGKLEDKEAVQKALEAKRSSSRCAATSSSTATTTRCRTTTCA
jgi:branched-chain amino acid transport system substrate-binding protein